MHTHVRALGVLAGCLSAAVAHGHGTVGQRTFIEPFVTEDVNPKNEFVIGRPEWDHSRDGKTLSLGFGLEKKLADRLSLTLDSEWLDISPEQANEPHASGFNNLGITLKYAFFRDEAHEAITSIALESTAPTGTGEGSFKPFLLYGKGAGDLPESLAYLRPFAVQGDGGFEISLDHDRSTVLAYNTALEYSIPYLQSFVRDFGLRWPLNNLVVDGEFNFETGVHGGDKGRTAAFATPGIVYVDQHVELGVAGRFPLNDRAHEELDWGIVWVVDLFIDDLFPWTRWQPFGGMGAPTPPASGAAL